MPFGLKNAAATYKRLVNKMFAQQIGKTMEVYMYDMLVKSVKGAKHLTSVDEMFSVLKKYKMMLNTTKCFFRVASRKFLGFMVNQRRIEANPYKNQGNLGNDLA